MEDTVVEYPRCHVEGSTACCNPSGRNCICVACEEREGMKRPTMSDEWTP